MAEPKPDFKFTMIHIPDAGVVVPADEVVDMLTWLDRPVEAMHFHVTIREFAQRVEDSCVEEPKKKKRFGLW